MSAVLYYAMLLLLLLLQYKHQLALKTAQSPDWLKAMSVCLFAHYIMK